jgi:hypothetical protein
VIKKPKYRGEQGSNMGCSAIGKIYIAFNYHKQQKDDAIANL